jgi:AcrR family transcriptional regulator
MASKTGRAPKPARDGLAKRAVSARAQSRKGTKEKWAERRAARREAILAAALDEFAERGFEGARLDDVARRAGIAKGTIYLYFADKETLFQELIRSALGPVVSIIEAAHSVDLPLRAVCDRLATAFTREVLGTRRKDIVRLMLSEGRRFPKIAKFYYEEVPKRAFAAVRALVRKGIARGEIVDDTLEKYPQLLIAPGLVAVVWDGLFDKYEPLDAEALLKAHFNLLFKAIERRTP